MAAPFPRRRLLARLGALGAVTLAGCGREPAHRTQSASPAAGLARVAPGAEQTLAVFPGQYELLVGPDQRVAFGLATLDNQPVADADIQVRFVTESGQAGPPVKPTFQQGLAAFPVYIASIDVPAPGFGFVVATTPDGRGGGEFAIKAVEPADSTTVPPGQPAISVPTPTTANPLDVAQGCTRRVDGQYAPCGMHAVSLDQSLAAGRPVMLSFATPQFCTSAMCGPVVDTIESIRTSREWGDVDWIHVEIYKDYESDRQGLVDAVRTWNLPSEPWLFGIDRSGAVVDRLEGPILPVEVSELAERIA